MAEGTIGVSITPLKYELNADAGTVLHETVTAINPNDFTLKVVPEFQDFKVLENAGIQWIPSDVENPYRMTDWITISSDPISIKPKDQVDIPFTITVPKNASVGGHYAAIFFRAVVDSTQGTIGSIPRVGALVIFNVNGVVNKGGELQSFSAPKFVNNGPVKMELTLKNTGTTHYTPQVSVSVQNIFGPHADVPAEQDKLIYPGVSRVIDATWNKSYPLGFYLLTANFTDGNGVLHTQKSWFIGFPWEYVLIAFLILVAIRYLMIYFKKKFKIVRV